MFATRSALGSPLAANSPLAQRLAKTPFLVVDDSPFVRRTVREILYSFSARIIADAADGYQGLDEARKLQPKVIILEWFMPGFSGSDFLRVLRHSRRSPAPDADVLVITGVPTASLVVEAQGFGVAAVIRKPFAPSALLERLAHPGLRLNKDLEPEAAPLLASLRIQAASAPERSHLPR